MVNGPLSGIRVVELEGIGPAPFCGMHLADLGADVIVIERKKVADGNITDQDQSILRRGKKSIALDLKSDEGRNTALALLDTADAMIEGMRPGVLERLKLGPDVLHARNKKIVIGRVTGWGQTGPLSQAAGHDLNYVGLSGAAWYASPAGQPPVPPPTLIGDIGGGALYLTIGLLAGILQARETGQGDVIDAAMIDGSAHMMNLLFSLKPKGLMPNDRGQGILDGAHWFDTYSCADGRFITIAALEEKFYREFLMRVGLDKDPDFEAQYERENWPAQKKKLAALFQSKPRDHWCSLLEGTDACFAPMLSPEEAAQHPHNTARNIYQSEGKFIQARVAPIFESMPLTTVSKAPRRGEHTSAILAELKSRGKAQPN